MQTFMVTPVMAQGFEAIFSCDWIEEYNLAVEKNNWERWLVPLEERKLRPDRNEYIYYEIASFLKGKISDAPIEKMVTLALTHAYKGFYPLPCTAESAVGQRLQRAWDEWVTNHPDAAPYVKHFGWKFFNPAAVATDVTLMTIAGETELVPLNIIVH